MRKKSNRILRSISAPTESFLIFLLVGLLINLLGTGLSNLFWDDFLKHLQKQLPISNLVQLRLWTALFLFVFLITLIYIFDLPGVIKSLLVKLRLVNSVGDATTQSIHDQPCNGLVVIMSAGLDKATGQPKTNTPAETAIREHLKLQPPRLQHCWILTTDATLENARSLRDRLSADEATRQLQIYYDQPIPNPEDSATPLQLKLSDSDAQQPGQTLKLVDGIYADAQRYRLDESDLIIDITGGMKPQSAGAFLAGSRPNRRIEYLTQEHPPRVLELKVEYQVRRQKT